jgi:hypothetical protein
MENNSRKKKKDSAATPDVAESVEKRGPIDSIREADCHVSIWHRVYVVKGKPTDFYSLTFERSYRDKNQTWRYTKSFSLEDLSKIVVLCQKAETAINELRASDAQ